MRLHGCREHDGVDAGIVEYAVQTRRHAHGGMAVPALRQTRGVEVADPANLHVEIVTQHAQEFWPPLAEPNHSDVNLPSRMRLVVEHE